MPPTLRSTRSIVVLAVLAVVVLLGAFASGIVFLVMSVMRSSEPYQLAMTQARADDKVTEQLGSPLEEGFFTTGQVQTTNDSGQASLEIPVKGPKGEAVVEVRATRSGGVWRLRHLQVRVRGSGAYLPLVTEASLPAEAPGR
ncbi:MAG: cytochrome c oxidase assembly factor Coa1 family protein [Myxococcales bacterium]